MLPAGLRLFSSFSFSPCFFLPALPYAAPLPPPPLPYDRRGGGSKRADSRRNKAAAMGPLGPLGPLGPNALARLCLSVRARASLFPAPPPFGPPGRTSKNENERLVCYSILVGFEGEGRWWSKARAARKRRRIRAAAAALSRRRRRRRAQDTKPALPRSLSLSITQSTATDQRTDERATTTTNRHRRRQRARGLPSNPLS